MRWMSRDPIGYDGGINLYGCVGGDPIYYVDPDGEDAVAIAIRCAFNPACIAATGGATVVLHCLLDPSCRKAVEKGGRAVAEEVVEKATEAYEYICSMSSSKKLERCLKACEGDYQTRAKYCRSLKKPEEILVCWKYIEKSEIECKNACYNLHSN
jgi:uncharacterized protein RhaS with RHS repeats